MYCAKSCGSCANITTTTTTTTTTTPTTPSTTQGNVFGCNNNNDYLCNFFGFGYCNVATAYVSGVRFAQFCKKLCNDPTCYFVQPTTTAQSPTCVDNSAVCAFWTNYCYLLANQVPHPCARTCKRC